MNRRVLDYALNIKPYDWLLIVGLMLAPMTGLRVWKVGPAEVLCLIWGLRHYPSRNIDIKNDVFRFFMLFLGSMVMGTIWGLIIAPKELHMLQWPTWIYLAYIALAMYTGLKKNTSEYNERIMTILAILSTIWYLFLYIYSIHISKVFLGAPLWYSGRRFTGGAKNPHQVAVLMCGLTFCFVRKALLRKYSIINMILAYICVFIVLQTASSTGVAALVIGITSVVYVITIHSTVSVDRKVLLTVLEMILLIICFVIFYNDIYGYVMDWIASDSNGMGRINLFNQIGHTILKSPFFGLGPGVHALTQRGSLIEYHNTYTEIIAATGLIGFIIFCWFTLKMFRNVLYDDLFLPVVVAMYVYGLGGFAMRRLAYWGIFIIIFVITEEKRTRFMMEMVERCYDEDR